MTYIEGAKGDKREAVSLFWAALEAIPTEDEKKYALLRFVYDIQAYDNEAERQYRRDSHFDNHF